MPLTFKSANGSPYRPDCEYHDALDLRYRSGRGGSQPRADGVHPRLTVAGMHAERRRRDASKALYRVLIDAARRRHRAVLQGRLCDWCDYPATHAVTERGHTSYACEAHNEEWLSNG